jgi:hypothetical protein
MPNTTSVERSPTTIATAAGRNARRSITPRPDDAYSSRARAAVLARKECPAALQIRARYSSAKVATAARTTAVSSLPSLASISGTEASITASTSATMRMMTSLAKREPAERGRWSCSSNS